MHGHAVSSLHISNYIMHRDSACMGEKGKGKVCLQMHGLHDLAIVNTN